MTCDTLRRKLSLPLVILVVNAMVMVQCLIPGKPKLSMIQCKDGSFLREQPPTVMHRSIIHRKPHRLARSCETIVGRGEWEALVIRLKTTSFRSRNRRNVRRSDRLRAPGAIGPEPPRRAARTNTLGGTRNRICTRD